MKVENAKFILESMGYTVKEKELTFEESVTKLLESMEARNATRTGAYAILNEMARFNGRYTGSFAGLEDAGTVMLKVRNNEKEYSVAEALSKIENDFKSANSKGCSQEAATSLLYNYDTALAAVPETANAEYVEELNKEREYISSCVEGGDGIPKDGWTAQGLARTTHSRDDSALSAKELIKKINNQITSIKKGGKNYDLIKARIDALKAREDELTAEENAIVDDLYTKLDIANSQGQANAVGAGKIAIFKPNEGINLIRIKSPLNQNNIPFDINDDGTFTIKKKVDLAKEVLEGRGEFIEPEPIRQSNAIAVAFENDDDFAAFSEEVLPTINVTVVPRSGAYIVDGTKAQIRKFFTNLDRYEIAYTTAPVDSLPPETEEETEVEPEEAEVEVVSNESYDPINVGAGLLSEE